MKRGRALGTVDPPGAEPRAMAVALAQAQVVPAGRRKADVTQLDIEVVQVRAPHDAPVAAHLDAGDARPTDDRHTRGGECPPVPECIPDCGPAELVRVDAGEADSLK